MERGGRERERIGFPGEKFESDDSGGVDSGSGGKSQ